MGVTRGVFSFATHPQPLPGGDFTVSRTNLLHNMSYLKKRPDKEEHGFESTHLPKTHGFLSRTLYLLACKGFYIGLSAANNAANELQGFVGEII